MESSNEASSRSLPPLVEGKVHGYLRLVIDEIVWSRRSPGDVTVLASWWGEIDSAQFRPADIKNGDNRSQSEITETYSIRTNFELFEEYLANCETVELVAISEKTHQVVGTARVSELRNLLDGISYFQYVPITNCNGSRIGDIHVTMKLSQLQRNRKRSPMRIDSFKRKQTDNILRDAARSIRAEMIDPTKISLSYENDIPMTIKAAKQSENIYRSILKERIFDPSNVSRKSSSGVNDKLVAQVVARAQRLRGAIIKEARDDDTLALSSSSTNESPRSNGSTENENEATLYEYFLGKRMTRCEERKALETLRATSPTPSLIDLAQETVRGFPRPDFSSTSGDRILRTKTIEEVSQQETASSNTRELAPIDHVDSLRIAVESLTLSSAGYRRVRSSCMSRGDGVPVSVTYFVQYDAIFSGSKKSNNFSRKTKNDSRPIKLCSKKQVGQVVYFNHSAVYDLQKTYLRLDSPLRFKIFNRHLNQRTPTELGVGSMYVADAARAPSLSSTQRLAIVCKGIKIGELKVTVELGCDRVHFGKQFVEAVTSAKENIPVLDVSSTSSLETARYRTATGSENGKTVSSSFDNRHDGNSTANNSGRVRQENGRRQQSSDVSSQCGPGERAVRAEEPRREESDKVLLHGLIYVAEGKDLEASKSYLICRAFWREDRAASRLCEETNNPFYHFHQLVPLIHGADLLERTKDNCIVIEVYSRNSNGEDHLLGIAKLPVHQLYVAYRDPQILPHLLRSKYPVISVDGWVVVADPVTGRPCGQLLALVALGTADQIALLEMTRGLRDSGVTPRTIRNLARNAGGKTNDVSVKGTLRLDGRSDRENYENLQVDHGRLSDDRNVKTQECQTEITTVRHFKPHGADEEMNENPQNQVLNAIVDRLAQALNVPKPSADQAAQTEVDFKSRNCEEKTAKVDDVERLNIDPSTNNSFSEDSDGSQRGNFHLSTEIYRSVGVGAEFDEAANQGPSTSYATADSMSVSGFDGRLPVAADRSSTNLPERDGMELSAGNTCYDNGLSTAVSPRMPISAGNGGGDSGASEVDDSSFRAVVEIECALHLPKVEKLDETIEPCTYVTFQKARGNGDSQYGSYVVTNLCPFSCSPKWDWRCDTKLSNDLLENEEKRLILKVWRLVDPETSMRIDLERDVVIGFSAIDVSVLTVGFPVVSGWFHVMDFTGKCNGQIKVSVTPLDNIGSLGKNTFAANASRPPLPDFDHSNFSSPYPADLRNTTGNGAINSARNNFDEATTSRSQVDNEPMLDLGLGDASMSFLSLSLKQKLTELDEIKKRLQSRLHDVTDTAFDDDFDNDFDIPLVDSEPHKVDNGNTDDTQNAVHNIENWPIPREDKNISNPKNSTEHGTMTNGNRCHFVDANVQRATTNSNTASVDANFTDTGYSSSSNVQSSSNGNRYTETEDNRFHSRLLSEENSNGFETISNFAVSPNLLNSHYDSHRQSNTRNRTDLQNVRNYRSVNGETLDFRGHVQDAGNVQNRRRVVSEADDYRHRVVDTGSVEAVEDPSNSDDRPIRGTRMHISHLLDKLTTQLTAVPPPTANQPMKRNIMDLITSLRRNNNNFPNDVKCNREVNVRTVPTQTEANHVSDSRISQLSNNSSESRQNSRIEDVDREIDEIPAKSKKREKVSTTIREELVADESNNDCDELSAHLMTTNVRHMNLESILNPLIYQHLIPDVQSSTNGGADGNCRISVAFDDTPEVEAVERLDTRYAENFNATINNGLSRLRNLVDAENSSRNSGRGTGNSENDEIFRMTPSGVSENIDGNIDVTVIHKPCNDELMASNSLDSTTTISMDNDTHAGTEIDDNSSLNSTDTSVSGVSRQAPEGGNPVEEAGGAAIAKRANVSRDSSSGS